MSGRTGRDRTAGATGAVGDRGRDGTGERGGSSIRASRQGERRGCAVRTVQPTPEGLSILGLTPGERIRFRRASGGRWLPGVVAARQRDGSIGVTDARGAARAIPVERIEVSRTGPRGGVGWEPLTLRAARSEQLSLL